MAATKWLVEKSINCFEQIPTQLTLRIKSLKNQLDISESELDLAQTDKRKIQDENLSKEKEIQVGLFIFIFLTKKK